MYLRVRGGNKNDKETKAIQKGIEEFKANQGCGAA
jgi:hypothetical protein